MAKQCAQEQGLDVTVWVKNYTYPYQALTQDRFKADVASTPTLRIWDEKTFTQDFPIDDLPDLVIESFGCGLPTMYLLAMMRRCPLPAWINLEHLSAEPWVETFHRLPSIHPPTGLRYFFYYPGFTRQTGGLLIEQDLHQRRQYFQQNPQEQARFLHDLGVTTHALTYKVSLFCYPQAPVDIIFSAWQTNTTPILCLIPQGVATLTVGAFLNKTPQAGDHATRGALTLHILPFLSQNYYDQLLWLCDLNFVRGEDSFIRAQWAAKPFVWHIYPQKDLIHHTKLNAFLQRYETMLPPHVRPFVYPLWQGWNQVVALEKHHVMEIFSPGILSAWRLATKTWCNHLVKKGDLVSRLLRFVAQNS